LYSNVGIINYNTNITFVSILWFVVVLNIISVLAYSISHEIVITVSFVSLIIVVVLIIMIILLVLEPILNILFCKLVAISILFILVLTLSIMWVLIILVFLFISISYFLIDPFIQQLFFLQDQFLQLAQITLEVLLVVHNRLENIFITWIFKPIYLIFCFLRASTSFMI